jgi:hypothetical protein
MSSSTRSAERFSAEILLDLVLDVRPSENPFGLHRVRSEAGGVVSPESDLSEYIVV